MKTTIEMPDELFRKVKAMAAQRGQSMKGFVSELLTREIDAASAPAASVRRQAADAFSQDLEALATQVGKEWRNGLAARDAVRKPRNG